MIDPRPTPLEMQLVRTLIAHAAIPHTNDDGNGDDVHLSRLLSDIAACVVSSRLCKVVMLPPELCERVEAVSSSLQRRAVLPRVWLREIFQLITGIDVGHVGDQALMLRAPSSAVGALPFHLYLRLCVAHLPTTAPTTTAPEQRISCISNAVDPERSGLDTLSFYHFNRFLVKQAAYSMQRLPQQLIDTCSAYINSTRAPASEATAVAQRSVNGQHSSPITSSVSSQRLSHTPFRGYKREGTPDHIASLCDISDTLRIGSGGASSACQDGGQAFVLQRPASSQTFKSTCAAKIVKSVNVKKGSRKRKRESPPNPCVEALNGLFGRIDVPTDVVKQIPASLLPVSDTTHAFLRNVMHEGKPILINLDHPWPATDREVKELADSHLTWPISQAADGELSHISEWGRDMQFTVVDCLQQSDMRWNGKKVQLEFSCSLKEKTPSRPHNLLSSELSSTAIGNRIFPAKFARQACWATRFGSVPLGKGAPGNHRYYILSDAGAMTDWHVDFSANTNLARVVRGHKVFYFLEPSAANLRNVVKTKYTSPRVPFDLKDKAVFKVDVRAGQALLLPGGWIHCVETREPSEMIVSDFLHDYNLIRQIEVFRLEREFAGIDGLQDDFVLLNFLAAIDIADRISSITMMIRQERSMDVSMATEDRHHAPANLARLREGESPLSSTSRTEGARGHDPSPFAIPTSDHVQQTPGSESQPTHDDTPDLTPSTVTGMMALLPDRKSLLVLAQFIQDETQEIIHSITAYLQVFGPGLAASPAIEGRPRRPGHRAIRLLQAKGIVDAESIIRHVAKVCDALRRSDEVRALM